MVLFRFADKAAHHIGGKHRVRHGGADARHSIGKLRRGIAARHAVQRFVTPALQRKMKLAAEFFLRSAGVD